MTIKQFQEVYYILKSENEDFDKSIKMVGCITGKTPEQVEAMPMTTFNKLCVNIKKQFEIFDQNLLKGKPKKAVFIKGKIYRLHYEVSKLPINAGKYVEALTFGKDVVTNLHKLMATIAEPIKWSWSKLKFVPYKVEHQELAGIMERLKFRAAYHAAVFFYTQYRVSMQLIQPYLVKELMSKGVSREIATTTLDNSSKILDGFTMPKWSLTLKTYLLNRFGA